MTPAGYLDTSVLFCGDNLQRLVELPDECVDLIYLDPPFFSNQTYEVIWGDEAEVRSFEDRWEGGINVYINWMRDRAIEMYRVLKPTGSIYLHCDWHASHYLKVMMDNVFGIGNFRNEIVWNYATGGAGKKAYARKHDAILFTRKRQAATSTLSGFGNREPKRPCSAHKIRRALAYWPLMTPSCLPTCGRSPRSTLCLGNVLVIRRRSPKRC